jgi:RND family efflux transporter MFP subunit
MQTSQSYRLTFLAAGMGAIALAVTGCNRPSAPAAPPQMPPPQVTVVGVEQRELVEWDEFTGRTAPVEYVEVRPRVSGYIQEARFQSGQLVKQGDVLFVIDPRWHQAEFDQREAELTQAQVRLDNAKREADRTAQLLAGKAISTEEAEARQSRYNEARAALQAARAARDTAKLDLDHTQVRAPISGRASRELVNVGNYVSGTAGAATMLTTIVSVDPVYVYADMDENSLLRFNALSRLRQISSNGDGKVPVELQLGGEDGFPHRGHIESTSLIRRAAAFSCARCFRIPTGALCPACLRASGCRAARSIRRCWWTSRPLARTRRRSSCSRSRPRTRSLIARSSWARWWMAGASCARACKPGKRWCRTS